MNGNDPEFIEAIRLIRKFFPESKRYISDQTGLDWCSFLNALRDGATFGEDWSCDLFGIPGFTIMIPEPSFSDRGGIEGSEGEVFLRILNHIGFTPTGRAVVVPDAMSITETATEDRHPFVCSANRVAERLDEMVHVDHISGCNRPYVFDGLSDSIFVFESGEAFLLQHDIRLFWARSHSKRTKPDNRLGFPRRRT